MSQRRKKESENLPESEPDKTFRLRLKLKSGVDGLDNYIEESSPYFINFNITYLDMLLGMLDSVSSDIVNNLFKVTSNPDMEVPLLEEEKGQDVFEKLTEIIDMTKGVRDLCGKSKAVLDTISDMLPEPVKNEDIIEILPTTNVFEALQKNIKSSYKK